MESENNLEGKVVLITGSTSGIGLGIAKMFASEGANVIINGIKIDDSAKQSEKELNELGAKTVLFCQSDLAKPDDIKKMLHEIKQKYSSIDILVNNAGIQFVSPIEDFPDEKFEAIMRVDLIASFYLMKAVVPGMKKKDWGRIVNIASAHALVASPFKSAYVAAKHGLLGLTKTVALEVAQNGITVNAICPGYVKTPLVLGQIADTAKARGISEEDVIKNVMLGPQATKKFVEIDEVAGFVKFLCSEKAGSITGTALSIDGGWTSQ